MILYEEQVCPYCNQLIGEGDTVYLYHDEIIGCDFCIERDVVHIETDEEREDAYREDLYEDEKISRLFDL